VNIPIGLIAFWFGRRHFPKATMTWDKVAIDWPGYATFSTMIIAFFVAIYWGQAVGFDHIGVVSLFAVAVILGVLFVLIEQRTKTPLIDLHIFQRRGFTIGIVTAMLVYMVGYFNNVMMPFYLQETLGLSAAVAGIILMAVPILNIVSAPTGGVIGDRIGAEQISFYALFIFLVPETIFILVQPQWSIVWLIVGLASYGLANGLFQNNPMIMGNAGAAYQGVAGSIAALARNLGMTIGLSLATSLLYFNISQQAGQRTTTYPHAHPQWFVNGMHFAYAFALGLIVLAIGLLGWLLSTRRQAKQ